MKFKSVFRFRQDLRLFDNTGFINATELSQYIYPIFIIDSSIFKDLNFTDSRFKYLSNFLLNLNSDLKKYNSKLNIFYGDPTSIINKLFQSDQFDTLFLNKSYGLGSQSRDIQIKNYLNSKKLNYFDFNDYLLCNPQSVPYRKIFTPFYNIWKKLLPLSFELKDIHEFKTLNYHSNFNITNLEEKNIKSDLRSVSDYKQRLNSFDAGQYDTGRNELPKDLTSKFSPYIRFGVGSIREIFNKFKDYEVFIKELARREFWHHISLNFPDHYSLEFQEKRRGLKRSNDELLFNKFCSANTGYPIIDAAIRQLINENRMHNRARMIVASFLTKDLLIDRRLGEKFFAKYLLDYDINVNVGNWQRAASVGADPKPIRIFSPILQAKRFDPDSIFIKKYIPEIKNVESFMIQDPIKYRIPYVAPIVDHSIQQRIAKNFYKGIY